MPLRVWGRLRGSFFLKILLVFVGAFVAIATYFTVTYVLFDWERERLSAQRTAMNYASYVLDDIGHPPDTARARSVSQRLGVAMRIRGPGLDWATSPDLADFDDVELPAYPPEPSNRAGIASDFGFSADVRRDGYRYLLALQSGRATLGSGTSGGDVADGLFMIAVLLVVYLITRRLLRPVRVLSSGVEKLRHGDLDVEMHTKRTDELGRLIISFNEMAKAVRERFAARDQLLLDVSHEIRSPLTRMKVALEMLPETRAKQSVAEDIEETEAMIGELLETERLDSPYGGLARRRTDLAEILRSSVAARAEEGPGVRLTGAEDAAYAEVDADRVRVVFNNLISNALKYSAPDGPPVGVDLAHGSDELVVAVRDRGVGIAPEDLAYVFEPFYRVDRSRAKQTGGYGLGLSLAKRITEAHGGSITVESERGVGTTVTVRLPVSPAEPDRQHPRWRL